MKILNYFLFLIIIGLFASCLNDVTNNGNNVSSTVLPQAQTLPYRSCSIDSDCVYVNNGCCDCANGGEDLAVNKTKLADFEALFDCANVACTMIGAVPECGSGTVSCKSGLCEYSPAL